jgi:hypothetical protein
VIQLKLSEKIEIIIYILEQCKKDYAWYAERLMEEENKKNDIMHELEGAGVDNKTPPKYDKRAALATKLQDVLITRRAIKDNVIINEPLFELVNSGQGKEMINKLKGKLGEVRKVEAYTENRKYNKRATESAPKNQALENLISEWKKDLKSRW